MGRWERPLVFDRLDTCCAVAAAALHAVGARKQSKHTPVSYTHLTLPTKA